MGAIASRSARVFDRRPTIRASRGPELRRSASQGGTAAARRQNRYLEELAGAEQEFDEKFAANRSPREEIYKFHVIGYLAGGATAMVFLVEHHDTKMRYAAKISPKEKFRKYPAIARLVTEKRILFACNNKFIIKGFFVFQDWKNTYTFMEHATYGDLLRLVETRHPKKTVKYFAAQIILGLEYLHACNIIHRDIKPGNIFIARDFYLKIGDFGIAKKCSDRTFSDVGTLQYKAPEMLQTRGYGKGVDWWALGTLVYRLLYTKSPFVEEGWTLRQIQDSILHNEVRFPVGIDPNAPQNTFITALLRKDCYNRIGCGSEGAEEIKNHEWFNDLSFLDVYDKKITLSASISPVKATVQASYDFMPRRRSNDMDTNWFQNF